MKKITIVLFLVGILFTSCAAHYGMPRQFNQNTTEVVLTEKNFKVVKTVKGEAEATYIFGIGGLAKNGLIAEAKSKMLAKSDIEGSSRTVINELVEVKKSGFLFVNKYKVIVSAQIIEFL
ncbi:MAG: hypothetical protein CMC05_12365 [Flavobacteriaceae bacterium]|nr:hypothetical protein [Flavobacteriaceae bacterium]